MAMIFQIQIQVVLMIVAINVAQTQVVNHGHMKAA